MGAADRQRITPMATDRDPSSFEPPHASSPTAQIVSRLELHGYQPSPDEPDPRPAPEDSRIEMAVDEIFEVIGATLTDTRSEPDMADLLWGVANVFHRAADRIQRLLDDNEEAQKRSQREQDGSEIKSVELERLLGQGQVLIDRRDSLETFRDHAAEAYGRHTGSAWRPRSGSQVTRRTLTATLIDSRDFLMSRRWAETQVLMPAGQRIAFTGGMDCNDHQRIWAALDRVHAKHPAMVLLHGGGPKGAELIASKWADHRKGWRRSPSDPTGPATPRRRRSSVTTSSWRRCRSVSWCSPARGSPRTWPTRPGGSASHYSTSAREAAGDRSFRPAWSVVNETALRRELLAYRQPWSGRVAALYRRTRLFLGNKSREFYGVTWPTTERRLTGPRAHSAPFHGRNLADTVRLLRVSNVDEQTRLLAVLECGSEKRLRIARWTKLIQKEPFQEKGKPRASSRLHRAV